MPFALFPVFCLIREYEPQWDRFRLGRFVLEVAPALVIHEEPDAVGRSPERAPPKKSSRRSGECLDFEIGKAVLRQLGLQRAWHDPNGDQVCGGQRGERGSVKVVRCDHRFSTMVSRRGSVQPT